jgi:hypothetical protein
MLRLLVVVLLVANLGYWAWSQGILLAYGIGPKLQSEPHHLQQQVKPDALRVLSPSEFRRVEAQAQADLVPKECLQVGPFDNAQALTVQRAFEATLPPGSWQMLNTQIPARWILYMGKFPNAAAVAKKQAELATLKIKTVPLQNKELEPGLSLAQFDNKAAAEADLKRLGTLGVRTARVVQELEASNSHQFKVPAVSEALKSRLKDVQPALLGKAIKNCS